MPAPRRVPPADPFRSSPLPAFAAFAFTALLMLRGPCASSAADALGVHVETRLHPPSPPRDTVPAGPTGTFAGVVRSANGPVVAEVLVGNLRSHATTDTGGRFTIAGVPAGTQIYSVTSVGCRRYGGFVRIGADSVSTVTCTIDCSGPPCLERHGRTADCVQVQQAELALVGRRCSRHHEVRLAADTVSIAYGLLVLPAGYSQAEQRRFPNAKTWWPGGCVTTDDSRSYTVVAYCPLCRAAREQWLAQSHARASARR